MVALAMCLTRRCFEMQFLIRNQEVDWRHTKSSIQRHIKQPTEGSEQADDETAGIVRRRIYEVIFKYEIFLLLRSSETQRRRCALSLRGRAPLAGQLIDMPGCTALSSVDPFRGDKNRIIIIIGIKGKREKIYILFACVEPGEITFLVHSHTYLEA